LDFGGGVDAALSRSVATEFIRKGTETVQIALVDSNASCARNWGAISVDCYGGLQEAGRKFDIVVASAIIEHIPYPRGVLKDLLASLRVGGGIYFRTPAVSSMIRLAARLGAHLDFTYPEHVHDMGQDFWERVLPSLALDKGFSLLYSRPSIVQSAFAWHPVRAAIAHMLKWPWYILRSRYTIVGGWEVVIVRTAD
jgi:SAM-dependent methyltransferase